MIQRHFVYPLVIICVFFFLIDIGITLAKENDAFSSVRYTSIYKSGAYEYFLDTETARFRPDPYRDEQLMDVWIQIVCSPDGIQTEIENRKDKSLSTAGYQDFAYSMRHYYFRTKERQMQLMSVRDYATNGKLLDNNNYSYATSRWEEITPQTLGEIWYKAIVNCLNRKEEKK